MIEEIQCVTTGFSDGGRAGRQTRLRQWAAAGFKLQFEHKRMPRVLFKSTGERQAGHLGVLKVIKEPQQGRHIWRIHCWGVESNKDGSRIQPNQAVGRIELGQECYGWRGTIVPHRGFKEAF